MNRILRPLQLTLKLLACFCLVGFCLVGVSWQSRIFAQDEQPKIQREASVARLDAATRRVVASMESRSRYRVHVTEKWTLDDDPASSGVNQFLLSAWHGGAFDLKIDAQGAGKQSLECHSDGVTLTRILDRPGGTLHSQRPGDLVHLLDDVLTETSLRNSGLDLLFRELPGQYLMAMAADVEYVATEEVASARAEHFRFNWGGDPANRKELWFALDDAPRLLKVVSAVEFAAGDGVKHQLRVESDLRWEAGDQVPEMPVALEIPSGSQLVADLYGYLLEGQTRELIGKPAPQVALDLLDGSKWDLARHRGKELVVVYFFTTWAAPSHTEMPVILEFIKKYEPQGVAFYAVNVGEQAPIVSEFVKAEGYSHPVVLDSRREASHAFGVTSLPAVVLIGKDGTLASAHVGNTPEVRAFVREELEQILGVQSEEK